MRAALEEHGVAGELIVIPDGEKAIRYLQSLEQSSAARPDLVILDLNLPRRPGREVLEFIRQSSRLRDTVVAILSSSDDQQDRIDAFLLGANRYLQKPLRASAFLSLGAVFKELLGGSSPT